MTQQRSRGFTKATSFTGPLSPVPSRGRKIEDPGNEADTKAGNAL